MNFHKCSIGESKNLQDLNVSECVGIDVCIFDSFCFQPMGLRWHNRHS